MIADGLTLWAVPKSFTRETFVANGGMGVFGRRMQYVVSLRFNVTLC